MEAVNILQNPENVTWDYDTEADVLYLSIGVPAPAVGIDIGDGLVLRFDEEKHEVVGLTVIGMKNRLIENLTEAG